MPMVQTLLIASALLAEPMNGIGTAQPTAQAAQPGPSQATELKLDSALNLVGCAPGKPGDEGRTAREVTHHNLVYRLTAQGLQGYTKRGVSVVGGLVPTPNLAAQPGTPDGKSDWTIVARAAANANPGGERSGRVPMPLVRIAPVASLRGTCPSP